MASRACVWYAAWMQATTVRANRTLLAGLSGYFILKGCDTRLAKRLAQTVTDQQWIPIADAVHGVELPSDGTIRCFLYEFWQADLQHEYSLIYANLPAADLTVAGAFTFYNQRTTIEAFFAQSRRVFNIHSMRSRKFNAIFAFLRFVFLTHNVLVWAKQACLADSDFAQLSTRQLLDHTHRIRAHITWMAASTPGLLALRAGPLLYVTPFPAHRVSSN